MQGEYFFWLLLFSFAAAAWRNKDVYMHMNTRQRTKAEGPEGVKSGEALCPLPSRKIFDDLVLKWHILMHISGILSTYFKFCCPRRERGLRRGPPPRKFLIITNKLIIIVTT